jgi:small-conductance mechanosensitive channel
LLQIARQKNFRVSEGILRSLRGFSLLWFGMLGITIALSLPNLPLFPTITLFLKKALLIVFLASATWGVAQLSVEVLRVYTTREDGVSPLTSLFEFLAKVVIFSGGFLVILGSIGISITPLLTAFGIGGVSIGLALQNTLSNLMSGINIITSQKVRPGDYIQLRTGEAGYVRDVDLKYTIIQEITENILVIPNTQILSSSFRNYSLPDRTLLIPVEISISYDSDLEVVETVTREVAREVSRTLQPQIPDDQPLLRYGKFDYYSILLTVYLKVVEESLFEHLEVKHEFIKRLHRRYQAEGIKIPLPMTFPYLPKSDREQTDER